MGEEFVFQPGQQFGKYKIVRPIATGGLSEVHEVEGEHNIKHILKIALPSDLIKSKGRNSNARANSKLIDPITRTIREAEILGELEHPHIIKPVLVLKNLPHNSAGLLLEKMSEAKTLEEVIKQSPGRWHPGVFADFNNKRFDEKKLMKFLNFFRPEQRFLSNIKHSLKFEDPIEEYQRCKKFLDEGMGLFEFVEYLSPLAQFFREIGKKYFEIPSQIELATLYLRERGIVHKDLHPQNILVDRYQQVKIIDFGLSQKVGEELDLIASRRTSPPEAYQNIMNKNFDLWSVGLITYMMLFQENPFSKKNSSKQVKKIMMQYGQLLDQVNDDIICPFTSLTFNGIIIPAIETQVDDILNIKSQDLNLKSYSERRKFTSSLLRQISYVNINYRKRFEIGIQTGDMGVTPIMQDKTFENKQVKITYSTG